MFVWIIHCTMTFFLDFNDFHILKSTLSLNWYVKGLVFKTRCKLMWWFGLQSVDKILYVKLLLQKPVVFYNVNPHFHRFPTMYNTWGLRTREYTKTNWGTRKNACFSSNYLAVFLHHLCSQDSSDLFWTVNFTFVIL